MKSKVKVVGSILGFFLNADYIVNNAMPISLDRYILMCYFLSYLKRGNLVHRLPVNWTF